MELNGSSFAFAEERRTSTHINALGRRTLAKVMLVLKLNDPDGVRPSVARKIDAGDDIEPPHATSASPIAPSTPFV